MKKVSKSFSSRLKELRGELSQKEMAEKLGVPQQTYAGWEVGSRQPKLDKLTEVALHFAVSADWLLGLTDEPSAGISLTASGGSVAANHSTVSTGGGGSETEVDRLLSIIESQQRVIESLTAGKNKKQVCQC